MRVVMLMKLAGWFFLSLIFRDCLISICQDPNLQPAEINTHAIDVIPCLLFDRLQLRNPYVIAQHMIGHRPDDSLFCVVHNPPQ
jgi:hypothetical protein